MKSIKSLVAGLALVASASAFATPVLVGAEQSLQSIINGLYTAAGTSVLQAPDVNLNQANESGQFQIEASGGSISTMIIEITGGASTNTFGIYDLANPTTFLQLYSGAASGGTQALLSVSDTNLFSVNFGFGGTAQFSSSGFGYYIGTAGGKFYSEATLNGGDDHLVMYQGDGDYIKLPTKAPGNWGASSYILGWEDLAFNAGSDQDYNDMVIYVESISVPEPGSLALLGLGLMGLAATARRKYRG